jgi:F-type H+-transporting ATPase subunit g
MNPLVRPMIRSPALRLAARRFESTSTQKATEAAKNTASKAQEGLSRVTSAAGPALAGAARGVTGALSKVGGRTGKVVGFIERQTPFVVYYSKVGLELARIVFRNRGMTPPSVSTFQTFYQNFWNSVRSGSILQSPQNVLQSVRNVNAAQLTSAGIVVAELFGFFTIGEIIGRFKLIGYRGETASHH